MLAAALAGCASLPGPVAQDLAREEAAGPGVVVVAFVDFQCPFCRRAHQRLESALAEREAAARVVLHHVPLASHPDAKGAAMLAICAELAGRAPREVARAVFGAPSLDIPTVAGVLGVDPGTCGADPRVEARLARDRAAYDEAAGDGVPVLWVGRARLDGLRPQGAYDEAVARALRP